MTPVYRAALGADFDNLHPHLQWRYGIDSTSGVAQMAGGILDSVYCNPVLPPPFVRHQRKRRSMPTRTSRQVPFTQNDFCYVDEAGRECLAVLRTFHHAGGDLAVNSLLVDGTAGLVDYFGDGPELLYPVRASVGREGSLVLQSGPMRWLSTGPTVGMRGMFGARMQYVEGWDEQHGRFRCDATVRNPVVGELVHYRGWFTAVDQPCTLRDIPDEAWPLRLERREG
ncbi:DUF4166 domain-containing protein [Williamsia sterculiae]|uniref:DUF4166 domain-containing protein n=1 Tax=Williamsia sterculiae TaxID=1344003 RepID=A0A1N7EYA4_9NOCA|nr:DUF4166 domain-containing protein [Williamsia sterculiae]SIR93044.1 protein of unknown function [Williamsia sterculiae]